MKLSTLWTRLKGIGRDVAELTPKSVRLFFKSPLVRFVLIAGVAGIIGNRFDATFIDQFVPWFGNSQRIANWFLLLLGLAAILSLFAFYFVFVLNESRVRLKQDIEAFKTRQIAERGQSKVYGFVPFGDGQTALLRGSDSFYPKMTELVTQSDIKHDLLVSVGEADFVNGWLLRIFEDAHAGRGEYPKIGRIIVRPLSQELCNELESRGWISEDFEARYTKNLKKLIAELDQEDIPVLVKPWDRLPPFHGFIYARSFLINSWTVDKHGKLHVRTPLYDCTAEEFPRIYEEMIQAFNDF